MSNQPSVHPSNEIIISNRHQLTKQQLIVIKLGNKIKLEKAFHSSKFNYAQIRGFFHLLVISIFHREQKKHPEHLRKVIYTICINLFYGGGKHHS
jgi:hypothetical protein